MRRITLSIALGVLFLINCQSFQPAWAGTLDGRYSFVDFPGAVVRIVTDAGGDLLLTPETSGGEKLPRQPNDSQWVEFEASRFLSGRFVYRSDDVPPAYVKDLDDYHAYSVRLIDKASAGIQVNWLAFPDPSLRTTAFRKGFMLRKQLNITSPSVAEDLAGRWSTASDTRYGAVFDIYARGRGLTVHRSVRSTRLEWSNPDEFTPAAGQSFSHPLGFKLQPLDPNRLLLTIGNERLEYTRDPTTPGLAGAQNRIGTIRRNNEGETPLHLVARNGDLAGLTQLLTTPGIDTSARDKAGNTPLHVAVLHSRTALVAALVAHDRSLVGVTDAAGRNPMAVAASRGETDSLKQMILIGEYVDAVLTRAIKDSDLQSLRAFISAGLPADVIAHNAVILRKVNVLEELLTSNPEIVTLEFFKGALGDAEIADTVASYLPPSGFDTDAAFKATLLAKRHTLLPALLAAGADPDQCLDAAIRFGTAKIVADVLAGGATPQASHLLKAVGSSKAEMVEALLVAGISADSEQPAGWPMIVMAANRADAPTVNALLTGGANVEAVNGVGLRALHLAVLRQDPLAAAVVQALVTGGADVNAPNHLGKSPLSTTQSPQIRQILQDAGAQ